MSSEVRRKRYQLDSGFSKRNPAQGIGSLYQDVLSNNKTKALLQEIISHASCLVVAMVGLVDQCQPG
jgi:hypothetical protein